MAKAPWQGVLLQVYSQQGGTSFILVRACKAAK